MGKEGIRELTVIPYKVRSQQQKIHILVCYINCKGNRETKNNDKTTKNQKGGKGLMGYYRLAKPSFIIAGSQKIRSTVDKSTTKHIIQKCKKPSEKLKTEIIKG